MSSEAHSAETEGTEVDKVNTGALGTLVAVGLFAMISICAAVTALVRHDIDVEQSDKDGDANQTVIELKAAQRGVLNGPASYLDRGKGLVSLPIESAKQIVVAELARDPNSATPPKPANTSVTSTAKAAPKDSSAPATTPADGKKPEEPGKSKDLKKGAGAKSETIKDQAPPAGKPSPAAPPAPASPPLSPTAASPGAKAPGPLKN